MARKLLDALYTAAGALAALCLISIGVLVLLSIATRLAGTYLPGLSEYAGYAMASSSFLALAYTFRRGGHIRVRLLLERLQGRARHATELWCLAVGAAMAAYLAWFLIRMVLVSYEFGDLSEGADATPLWIPQSMLALGAAILALAVADRLVAVLRGGDLAAPDEGAPGPD